LTRPACSPCFHFAAAGRAACLEGGDRPALERLLRLQRASGASDIWEQTNVHNGTCNASGTSGHRIALGDGQSGVAEVALYCLAERDVKQDTARYREQRMASLRPDADDEAITRGLLDICNQTRTEQEDPDSDDGSLNLNRPAGGGAEAPGEGEAPEEPRERWFMPWASGRRKRVHSKEELQKRATNTSNKTVYLRGKKGKSDMEITQEGRKKIKRQVANRRYENWLRHRRSNRTEEAREVLRAERDDEYVRERLQWLEAQAGPTSGKAGDAARAADRYLSEEAVQPSGTHELGQLKDMLKDMRQELDEQMLEIQGKTLEAATGRLKREKWRVPVG